MRFTILPHPSLVKRNPLSLPARERLLTLFLELIPLGIRRSCAINHQSGDLYDKLLGVGCST